MNNLYLFIFSVFLVSFSFAQTSVPIESGSSGTGSSNNVVVGRGLFHVSESIYTSSEIGNSTFTTDATAINKIGFKVDKVGSPSTVDSIKIYMKNSTKSNFTSDPLPFYDTSNYKLVFKGSIIFNTLGFVEFNLDNKFKRTPNSSLQVLIVREENVTRVVPNDFKFATANSTDLCRSNNSSTTKPISGVTNLTNTAFRPAIKLMNVIANDVSIKEIIYPVPMSCFNTNQTIKLVLKNAGINTIPALQVSINYIIRGANNFDNPFTLNENSIPAGGTDTISFSGINLNNQGVNFDTATLNWADDDYRINDTLRGSFKAATLLNLPLTETVETTPSVFEYKQIVAGDSLLWSIKTGSHTNARMTPDSIIPKEPGNKFHLFDPFTTSSGSSAKNGFVSRLYSNCVEMPLNSNESVYSSKIMFWMSHDTLYGLGTNDARKRRDSLYVSVSTDRGTSWTRLVGFARIDSTLSRPTWAQHEVDLSAYNTGQTIQIGLEGVSYSGNAFGVDSIDIRTCKIKSTLSVSSCTTYVWKGQQYNTSGRYTFNSSSDGCSTTEILDLTNIGPESSFSKDVCDSFVLRWNDPRNPLDSIIVRTTDTLVHAFRTSLGCDSIVTAYIKIIGQSTQDDTSVIACNSYTWYVNGNTYTNSGTYSFKRPDQCHTRYLHLTINRTTFNQISENACDSYTWPANGQTYTNSGIYSFTGRSVGGCDSTVFLNLRINRRSDTTITLTACTRYTWNGTGLTYTNSGIYTYNGRTVKGCDSVVILNLTIESGEPDTTRVRTCISYTWPVTGVRYTISGFYSVVNGCRTRVLDFINVNTIFSTDTTVATACGRYTWSGNTYTTSGRYTATVPSYRFCDSVVYLNLTIIPYSTSNITRKDTCSSYTWPVNGQTYRNSGRYAFINGCRIDSLYLTINRASSSSSVTTCGSYTWSANGRTYTNSGVYTDTVRTQAGCDSIVFLNLTIPIFSSTISQISCNSYTWSATQQTYTNSGSYIYTGRTIAGCDSIVILELTINRSTATDILDSACNSYTWAANGQTYTNSGVYTYTGRNAIGCDSFVYLNLTINPGFNTSFSQTSCNSYTWPVNGQTYTNSGTYSYIGINSTGCDSLIKLNLIITRGTNSTENITSSVPYEFYGQIYRESGTYTHNYNNSSGCASSAILNLTITAQNQLVTVFPNPNNGIFKVDIKDELGMPLSRATINVYDVQGRRVFGQSINTNAGIARLDLSSLVFGIYQVEIKDESGKLIGTRKMIIQ